MIDDDPKMIRLLSQYLTQHAIEFKGVTSAAEGMRLLASESPGLVILDVMMPEKNGFDLCKEIRQTSSVPIIMLTARGEVTDRIVGLELGADDYLAKPFEPRELLARIQTVLRRAGEKKPEANPTKVVMFGTLEIDLGKKAATLKGESLDLTTMEFETLALLSSHAAQVLSRDEILDHLRGIDWEAYNRSIDVVISRLRQKLHDDPKHPVYLKTVWGSGYMFIADKTPEGKS
jgi:two-component system phosphate regulon response regulator OmpR